MMLRRFFPLLLALVPLTVFAKAAPKAPAAPVPTIAVLDLSFTPAEEELAVTAAEALNAELIATKAFTVVERRKISHVLREQALGQAGVISEESAAKVGQIVGAKLLVTGRLSKLGDLYRLDARLIDSETAKVVTARHAEFHERANLQLAVREVAAGLADPSLPQGTTAGNGSGSNAVDKAPPDVPVDSAKAKDAAAELAKLVGEKFIQVRAKITNVDEGGMAAFNPGAKLVFRGMRMEVLGEDEMSGGRTRKGFLLVQRADGSEAWGATEADSSPVDNGDDVVSLPFAASVSGPSREAVRAVSKALETLPSFTSGDNKKGTPVRVELELKGTTIGERHLVMRILDPSNEVQGAYESTVGL